MSGEDGSPLIPRSTHVFTRHVLTSSATAKRAALQRWVRV